MTDLEYLKKYGEYTKENIDRLNSNEPVQYIVGNVDFYGNIIKIDKRVLIPRFETEELIEKTLEYLKKTNLDIVDLGTGSGCIAITLKKLLPNSNIDAVDISTSALDLARENAQLNNVNINFFEGDMLEPLQKKYDCIISNPPYIAYNEDIMDVVKNNEPHLALYAKNNGLYYYEKILSNARKYLKDNFVIAFEIGYNQADSIMSIANKYFNDSDIIIKKDMQKFDRFCFIVKGS